jgi:hypothetical protein
VVYTESLTLSKHCMLPNHVDDLYHYAMPRLPNDMCYSHVNNDNHNGVRAYFVGVDGNMGNAEFGRQWD